MEKDKDKDGVPTFAEVRREISDREQEFVKKLDPTCANECLHFGLRARDEALERLCSALQYLENSLAEVNATRNRMEIERQAILRELNAARTERDALDAELRSVRLATREVERQMETDEHDDPDAVPADAR